MHTRRLLIDASVYLSALLEMESNSEVSRKFFERLRIDTLHIAPPIMPTIVVLEIANVLIRHSRPHDLHASFQALSAAFLVSIDREFILQSLPFLRQVRLKTADAVLAACAAIHGATLITWDAQLLREARKVTSAATPKDILLEL